MTDNDMHCMMVLQQWKMGVAEKASKATRKRYYAAVDDLRRSGIVWPIFYELWKENKNEIPVIHGRYWEKYMEWAAV